MDEYLIPTQFGEAEFVEKKSRFIGRVWPVDTEEEALAKIQEMKKKHYDATQTAGRTSSETARCASPMTANPAALRECPCCRFCSGKVFLTWCAW